MRLLTILSASLLAFACGTQEDDLTNTDQGVTCVRVDGATIGQRITVEVPSIDATMPVTFTAWVAKADDPSAFIAFALDLNATFNVKAGDELFSAAGSTWISPQGTDGQAIEYVELCTAQPDGTPLPPVEGGGGDGGDGGGSDSDDNCHGAC